MVKIQMKNAIAELDGDEMTRVLWKVIKDEFLLPYIDLKTEYFDLGLKSRDDSNDKITYDAADAIKRLHVGVKCATITSNQARVEEYHLKQLTPSPNGIIRAELDGTVFREPIFVKNIHGTVSCWKKPIVLGRHAYGDVYKNCEIKCPTAGRAELVFTGVDGMEIRKTIMDMSGPGIIQGIHNMDSSIENFARCCFTYALDRKLSVWIDDAVARVMRSEGGFMWATKNYDGDVMSDMIASACGSLAMMTSVLVSPDGNFEYEASHGTVQKHYYRYLKGEKTSTNPVATIFAWTGALAKRGEMDGTPELTDFAKRLEKATLQTIEEGYMTGDIARIAEPAAKEVLDSWQFIAAIRSRL